MGFFPVQTSVHSPSSSLTTSFLFWQWREHSAGLFGWDPGQDYSMCHRRLLPEGQGKHGPGWGGDSQQECHRHQAWGTIRRWENAILWHMNTNCWSVIFRVSYSHRLVRLPVLSFWFVWSDISLQTPTLGPCSAGEWVLTVPVFELPRCGYLNEALTESDLCLNGSVLSR